MLNLLKLDIRRIFRSKLFYILAACVGLMVMTVVFLANTEGSSIASLLGAISADNNDMMSAMMGVSVVPAITIVGFCLFVGSDFQTGFVKNIFTVHVSKWDYLISKLISGVMMISFLILLDTILTVLVGVAMGIPLGPVTIGGIIVYLLEKILLSIPLVSLTIFIQLFLKHTAWGILFGILVGMGGLTMGLGIFADIMHWAWLHTIISWTISGSSSLANMTSTGSDFIHCVIVSVVWSVLSLALANVVLKKKNF